MSFLYTPSLSYAASPLSIDHLRQTYRDAMNKTQNYTNNTVVHIYNLALSRASEGDDTLKTLLCIRMNQLSKDDTFDVFSKTLVDALLTFGFNTATLNEIDSDNISEDITECTITVSWSAE